LADDKDTRLTDEAITHNYDVNDRLLTELFDDKTTANADTTTTYGYDHTQQTSKIVNDERQGASLRLSAQSFTYSLQGRINTVINDGYTNGTLSSRERTTYLYNSGSYRVHLITETGTTLSANAASETWTLKSETSFLADSHNHTGYTQTIRETKVGSKQREQTKVSGSKQRCQESLIGEGANKGVRSH
jgi:hypothetical protein